MPKIWIRLYKTYIVTFGWFFFIMMNVIRHFVEIILQLYYQSLECISTPQSLQRNNVTTMKQYATHKEQYEWLMYFIVSGWHGALEYEGIFFIMSLINDLLILVFSW